MSLIKEALDRASEEKNGHKKDATKQKPTQTSVKLDEESTSSFWSWSAIVFLGSFFLGAQAAFLVSRFVF